MELYIIVLKEHLCDLIKQRICQVDIKLFADKITCSVEINHGIVINESAKIRCEEEVHCGGVGVWGSFPPPVEPTLRHLVGLVKGF